MYFALQADATQQELKASGQGQKTEQDLRKAAQSFLRAGALRRYCEVMVRLGEWDKALSVAPGVSLAYWQQVNKKSVPKLLHLEVLGFLMVRFVPSLQENQRTVRQGVGTSFAVRFGPRRPRRSRCVLCKQRYSQKYF